MRKAAPMDVTATQRRRLVLLFMIMNRGPAPESLLAWLLTTYLGQSCPWDCKGNSNPELTGLKEDLVALYDAGLIEMTLYSPQISATGRDALNQRVVQNILNAFPQLRMLEEVQ